MIHSGHLDLKTTFFELCQNSLSEILQFALLFSGTGMFLYKSTIFRNL